MRVVWKFPLALSADEQVVHLPEDAVLLHVAMQRDAPTLWAEVTPDARLVARTFRLIGTGVDQIPDQHRYRGTVFHGWLVLHVYERTTDA